MASAEDTKAPGTESRRDGTEASEAKPSSDPPKGTNNSGVVAEKAAGASGAAEAKAADPGDSVPPKNGADAAAAGRTARPPRKPWPNLLTELGMKVTAKGVLLPERRRTYLQRRRERRQLELANAEDGVVPAVRDDPTRKRKPQQRRLPLDELESDLFYAAHQGSLEGCRATLAQGVDVNVRTNADLDGVGTAATALHVAAVRGHEEVVFALLKAGADALATTGRGETPAQLATRTGNLDVVKVLRAAGGLPAHAEGMSQLMGKAPASWDDGKRKKLRGVMGATTRTPLPPPPAPPSAASQGRTDDRPRARPPDDASGNEDGQEKRRPAGKSGKGGAGKGKKGGGKEGKEGKGRIRSRHAKGKGKDGTKEQ